MRSEGNMTASYAKEGFPPSFPGGEGRQKTTPSSRTGWRDRSSWSPAIVAVLRHQDAKMPAVVLLPCGRRRRRRGRRASIFFILEA